VHADGSGLRRITDERESSLWPAWSPDGSRIAFVRFEIGSLEPGQLYTAAPDGSDVRQVQGVVFAPPSTDRPGAGIQWSEHHGEARLVTRRRSRRVTNQQGGSAPESIQILHVATRTEETIYSQRFLIKEEK